MRGRRRKNVEDRQIILAVEEGEVYGQVVHPLGQGQFVVNCSDRIRRTAKVRGRDYKFTKMEPNDIVLLRIREGKDSRADIDGKYQPKEIKILRELGHIKDDTFVIDEDGSNVKVQFELV